MKKIFKTATMALAACALSLTAVAFAACSDKEEEHVHSYGGATWTWASDYSSATASFSCTDNDDTQTVTATVTSDTTTAATCTTGGVITYTASATFDGKTYTDAKTQSTEANGHTLTHVEAVAATCTAAGNAEYWHCSVCDKYYSDSSAASETTLTAVTIAATGHTYGSAVWTWATDYSSAKVTITCADCNDVQEVTAYVSSATTEATCTTAGVKTHTATATYDGVTYNDTKTESIPTTAHTYSEATYSEEKWYAVCSVCGATTTTEVTDTSGYTLLASDATSLAAAVSAGTSIKLSADVEIDADDLQAKITSLSNNTALVIDVAGHKLTISDEDSNTAIDIENGKSLTIKDSTNTSGAASTTPTLVLTNRSGTQSNIRVYTGSSVTLDSVVVSATGPVLFPQGDAAAVTVTNSRLVTTGAYVVATNSATVENYGVVITLQNSYLETQYSASDSCAVMINVSGTLNISNCEIVGQKLGVVVRAGTATMTNTSVTCSVTTSVVSDDWKNYTTFATNWGSGTAITMGAVVVGNNTSATYKADAKLTITGCTISYNITDNTENTLDDYVIGLYLMRSNSTNSEYAYNTEVTVDSATTISGSVVNIVKNNTNSVTSTLKGYSGTVITSFATGASLTADSAYTTVNDTNKLNTETSVYSDSNTTISLLNNVSLASSSKTYEGTSFSYQIKTNGAASTSKQAIKITLVAGATITVYAKTGNNGSARGVLLLDSDGNAISAGLTPSDASYTTITLTATMAGTYYLGSADSGIVIIYVGIEYSVNNTAVNNEVEIGGSSTTTVTVGDTLTLTATVDDENDPIIGWFTSSATYATVSDGVVSFIAVKDGETSSTVKIYAYTASGAVATYGSITINAASSD